MVIIPFLLQFRNLFLFIEQINNYINSKVSPNNSQNAIDKLREI